MASLSIDWGRTDESFLAAGNGNVSFGENLEVTVSAILWIISLRLLRITLTRRGR